MSTRLGTRALNRATLARQLLLDRAELPVLDAVSHVCGLQAQEPQEPFVGLWSRLRAFDPATLSALLTDGAWCAPTSCGAPCTWWPRTTRWPGGPGTARYAATSGPLVRTDLCLEALRLARALADLMPDEPEVLGLLALLLLVEARRPARVGPGGELVTLAEQDRSLWNRELIAEGHDLVRRCLRRNRPGPYQLQAAINAVHTDGAATDWTQVLALHDQLLAQTPAPIVALNRAVAVAEVHGPAKALAAVEGLELPGYHLLPATRADLPARLGRTDEARAAYDETIMLAGNHTERAFLEERRAGLDAQPSSQP